MTYLLTFLLSYVAGYIILSVIGPVIQMKRHRKEKARRDIEAKKIHLRRRVAGEIQAERKKDRHREQAMKRAKEMPAWFLETIRRPQ